jgi:hypothetical protein
MGTNFMYNSTNTFQVNATLIIGKFLFISTGDFSPFFSLENVCEQRGLFAETEIDVQLQHFPLIRTCVITIELLLENSNLRNSHRID